MTDPLGLLEEGCYLCLRFGMVASPVPGGCLRVADGAYLVNPAVGRYHPLEAVLVGRPAGAGGWRADARDVLGVSDGWVAGFEDGFALAPERADYEDYRRGYGTAGELIRRCYRRLPARGWGADPG